MRFTGGDNLAGLEAKLHAVFMQTELQNGLGAYEVSLADGSSGISFGGNQMDLAKGDSKYREIFFDILARAKMSDGGGGSRSVGGDRGDRSDSAGNSGNGGSGNKIFSDVDLSNIKALPLLFKTGHRPQLIFGGYLPKINQALSSKYGIEKLNEVYRLELKKILTHVERAIMHITNVRNRKIIAASDEWKVRLADYHNQFYLDTGKSGKLISYLSGNEVVLRNFVEGNGGSGGDLRVAGRTQILGLGGGNSSPGEQAWGLEETQILKPEYKDNYSEQVCVNENFKKLGKAQVLEVEDGGNFSRQVYTGNDSKTKTSKKIHVLKLEGKVKISDLIKFYHATHQYNKSAAARLALNNRLKKINALLGAA